jgi:hypothetical protein
MKKIILIGMFLAGACGPSRAGSIYTPGQQWPQNCGASGLFLESTGNCTSTWASQSPPTSLLASTNTWTARQDFGAGTFSKATTFGGNTLGIDASGNFYSPGNSFVFLRSDDSTYMGRLATIQNCWTDHVNPCTGLEIGPFNAAGFTKAIITGLAGGTFERLTIHTSLGGWTPTNYASDRPPIALFEVANDTSTNGANNANVVFAITGASNQSADLMQVRTFGGTTLSRITVNGGYQFTSKTLAQLGALTPVAAGETYYCSDCTTDAVCVSTGTAAGAFAGMSARTTACQ